MSKTDSGVLSLDGFSGSGADWLERFKPYIEDGKTVVVGPHRVWGPQTNDLVLQLRKRRHGRPATPRVGRRLHGGARQLRVTRTRSLLNDAGYETAE